MPKKQTAPKLMRSAGKQKFIYQQVADYLTGEIKAKRLPAGAMIPSLDELARLFSINKATVRQAIAALTVTGQVYTLPSRGTFVADPAQARKPGSLSTPSIGWISSVADHGFTGRYHTEILDAVRRAVQASGGHLLLFASEGLQPMDFCRTIGRAELDGAILVGPAGAEPIRTLITTGLPAVLIDDVCRGHKADSILVDNEQGGALAMEHLIVWGHRRLAVITGPLSWKVTGDRLAGARSALEQAGLAPESLLVVEADFSPAGGFAAMKKIAGLKRRPTGVFCFNDEMASGALQALHQHSNLRVPQDISLVGFDDITWASMTSPPLTTVGADKTLIGREAVTWLQRIIGETGRLPTVRRIPTRLIRRGSTGPAP